MAAVNINFRMDENLKKQAEALFEDMGMNMTTALTVFVKTAVRQGKIPFEVSADPFWNEANQARLKRAIADLDAGKGAQHELLEAGDA